MNKDHIVRLNRTAVSLIRTLFSLEFAVDTKITAEARPSFMTKYLTQIGLRNPSFQLCLILGMEEETAGEVLAEVLALSSSPSERLELAKSALGVLANTVACEFASLEPVEAEFGKLLPTPPLIWVVDDQLPDFIEADGISGRIKRGTLFIHTHFSVLSMSQLGGKGDRQHWSPTRSLSIFDPHSMSGKASRQ